MKTTKFFKRDKPRICEAVHFIFEYARKTKYNENYKRSYRCIARHLQGYENERGVKLYSNSFTSDVAEDFVDYLLDKNLMLSTVSGYFDKICFMFRKMGKRDFNVDYSFEDYFIESEDATSVYITMQEIERIYNMKIRTKERDVVRDRLVCNCLTGMRIGDFNALSSENVINDVIFRKTQKTGETIEVPVHPIVRKILNKYNGEFPPYYKSLQNYNKIIKSICKQAGLTDKVRWERTVGKRVVRKTFKRYELISSHTARRSFATNTYLAGILPARIMLITGHKSETSFFRYIRINKKENARVLAEHPFFK